MVYLSQLILYPYAYDFTLQPSNRAECNSVGEGMVNALRAVSGETYGMGQQANTLQISSGMPNDWAMDAMKAAGNSGPLSYRFELRDRGRYGWILPSTQIEPNCREVDGAMEYLIKYVRDNK